jgi:hypothetical protein
MTDLLGALLGGGPGGRILAHARATVLWKCFLRVPVCTVAVQRMRR